jgi:hypothetical protein
MPPCVPPPPRPGYNWGRDGRSRQGSIGNHILKPGVDAVVKKPSWDGKETIFRPYPCLSYEDPLNRFEPYRTDPGGRAEFGDWIRRYDVAWGVGNPATTFILHNPDESDPGYDPWLTPLGVLYRAIEKACKAGKGLSEWQPLREGAPGKGKALSAPSEAYFMQGALMKYDDKLTFTEGRAPLGWPPNPPIVLMLSGGAGRKLVNMLGEENEGRFEPPEDQAGYDAYFEARYVHGDPVGVNNGRYIHLFEKGHDPREKYLAHPTTSGGPAASPFGASSSTVPQARGGDGDAEFRGYDMFLTKDANLGLPNTLTQEPQLAGLRRQWRWWDHILFFPTPMEQAHLLFRVFPLSACFYAFEGVDSEWIPEDARRKYLAAHSASVPAAMPGQQVGVANPFGGMPQQPMLPPQPPAPTTPPPARPGLPGSPFGSPPSEEEAGQDSVVPETEMPTDGEADEAGGLQFTPPVVPPKPEEQAAANESAAERSAAAISKVASARRASRQK